MKRSLFGEDLRKEEASIRGQTGSCRRPADQGLGDLLSVSERQEWWLGSTAAKYATRKRRLDPDSSSVMRTFFLLVHFSVNIHKRTGKSK